MMVCINNDAKPSRSHMFPITQHPDKYIEASEGYGDAVHDFSPVVSHNQSLGVQTLGLPRDTKYKIPSSTHNVSYPLKQYDYLGRQS